MDDITMKNLELFSSSYESSEKYSLIGILDQTQTTSGARYLRYLLMNPIHTLPVLQERQKHITRYQQNQHTKLILKLLGESFDTNKLMSTILYKKPSPLPFVKLRSTLAMFFSTDPQHQQSSNIMKAELTALGMQDNELNQLAQLWETLHTALKADDQIKQDAEFIADAFDPEVDRLRKIAYHSDELLLEYQQFLARATGIHNVKLKFVMNQGYFIEITQRDSKTFEAALIKETAQQQITGEQDKLALIRRNTLKDNQRYSSPYLEQIQSDILSAREKVVKREFDILEQLRKHIETHVELLTTLAQHIAELDVYASHALFALEQKYIKPDLNTGNIIHIQGGRHPVIEAYLPKDLPFIPNDLTLGKHIAPSGTLEEDNGLIHIITGPNMGGKSTYLRQSALIVLLAHCGLFVPATSAKI
jgi:DNA mismatch repair protein MutS